VRIDLYASRPHYASHMLPIWRALPRHLRGRVMSPRDTDWWARDELPRDAEADVVTMVAGYCDIQALDGRGPLIYVEHGAGQTYPGDPVSAGDASYSGGIGHDDTVLFVAPSATVAARWHDCYPESAVVVAGCPLLDDWHIGRRPFEQQARPTLAITFHWDCQLIPETRSAFRHYEPHLARCVAAWRAHGFDVVGHGHPRVYDTLTPIWQALDVPQQPLGWIYDHVDLLIGDNTSALYEFASLGRDVLALNAPWYRRTVNHGLRFWSHVPGHQADDADQMISLATLLLDRETATLAGSSLMRRGAVAEAYAHTDGYAAWRAATAISALEDAHERDLDRRVSA
jgi:hypothetical protein